MKRKHFPMSWADWSGGVKNIYAFLEDVEARLARGETIPEEKKKLFEAFKRIRDKYSRDGKKKL